jgi:hypothetical protein
MRHVRDLEVKFLVGFDERVQSARHPSRLERLFIRVLQARYFGRFGSKRCELSGNSFQNNARFKEIPNDSKTEFRHEVSTAWNYFKQLFVVQPITCFSKWSAPDSTMPQYFRLVKETSLWKFAAQDPMLDYSVRMLYKSAALALFRL